MRFLPNRDRRSCLFVSTIFHYTALRVLFRLTKAYLNESFYHENGRASLLTMGPGTPGESRWDTSVRDNEVLRKISRHPKFAAPIHTLALVMKHAEISERERFPKTLLRTSELIPFVDMKYAKEALKAIPRLRCFRLAVDDFRQTSLYPDEDAMGTTHELMPILFDNCRDLEELVLPGRYVLPCHRQRST